jgi:hypothetical protein
MNGLSGIRNRLWVRTVVLVTERRIAMVSGRTAVLGCVVVTALALAVGCATVGGPSDEAAIKALVDQFVAAGNSQNLEGVLALFSDDFETETGETKEDMEMLLEEGFSAEVDFGAEDAKITIIEPGKKAKINGITVDYSPYFADVVKESGGWKIISSGEDY